MVCGPNQIAIIGAFASGKTELTIRLQQGLDERDVPYLERPFSDADNIVQAIMIDDELGGRNHWHPWGEGQRGHNHKSHRGVTPFTAVGDLIADLTTEIGFNRILEAPTDSIVFVELSYGGENKNPNSTADFSCTGLVRRLEEKEWPLSALNRFLAVVHPEVSADGRIKWNMRRKGLTYADKTVASGRASFWVPPDAMALTAGEDDWSVFRDLCQERGVPRVLSIPNEPGSSVLDERCRELAEEIALYWRSRTVEGVRGREVEGGPLFIAKER